MIEGVLVVLGVALLGYLTGRRFPDLGTSIRRWGRLCRAAVSGRPGPWRWWLRLLLVMAAFVGTAPVWPVLQPGDPVADEMLKPAEVAGIVPVVLVFPIGRSAWLPSQ